MTNRGGGMYRKLQITLVAIGAMMATTQLSFSNSDICARMQERLDTLNSHADPEDPEFALRRDRVEAALDANNCPVTDQPQSEAPQYDVPLYEQPQRDYPLHEEPQREAAQPQPYEILGSEPESIEPEMSTAPFYGGRYQTLCVRACDGYYFPISYETGAENFARDQTQCQAQCPGAKLYYQPTDTPNPETMISLRGDVYKNMPNAFKFRAVGATATPQCTCQKTAGNFQTLGNPRKVAVEPVKPAPAPQPPQPKPVEAKAEPAKPIDTKSETSTAVVEPVAKPSSIIQLGEPATAKIEKPKPLTEDKPLDPNRKVRVVGPTFLPDQAGATSPQAPDQKSAQ
ncbi:DUF2865 domain-containing protein [Phyllobacterium brassicacearum]|nr:DUF2865 domain-containing protein [Phyllobacterium brassicacearum]